MTDAITAVRAIVEHQLGAIYEMDGRHRHVPYDHVAVHDLWQHAITATRRLILWRSIESGTTTQLVARALVELRQNPDARVGYVVNTGAQAVQLRKLFDREMARLDISNQRQGRGRLEVVPIQGEILNGRLDLVIWDCALDYQHVRTKEARDDAWRWAVSSLCARLTAGSRLILADVAWHPDDVLHRFARGTNEPYHHWPPICSMRSPAEAMPERYQPHELIRRRLDFGDVEAGRQFDCIPSGRDDESYESTVPPVTEHWAKLPQVFDNKIVPPLTVSGETLAKEAAGRFQAKWIEQCLELGTEVGMVHSLDGLTMPDGAFCITGLDLGFTRRTAAKSVFTTVLFSPDARRRLLWIESGEWPGQVILTKIREHQERFRSAVHVESDGAKHVLLSFAAERFSTCPVAPHVESVAASRWSSMYGIESIGLEMAHRRWILPSGGNSTRGGRMHPELEALVGSLRSYEPTAPVDGYLMSLWFAREGGRSRTT